MDIGVLCLAWFCTKPTPHQLYLSDSQNVFGVYRKQKRSTRTVYSGLILVIFSGGLVRIFARWRRIREDMRKGSTGAGAGYGWAPHPLSGGASYGGGPMYPIDAEVAARVKAVQLLELEARERA